MERVFKSGQESQKGPRKKGMCGAESGRWGREPPRCDEMRCTLGLRYDLYVRAKEKWSIATFLATLHFDRETPYQCAIFLEYVSTYGRKMKVAFLFVLRSLILLITGRKMRPKLCVVVCSYIR